jgi:hypothetical protein
MLLIIMTLYNVTYSPIWRPKVAAPASPADLVSPAASPLSSPAGAAPPAAKATPLEVAVVGRSPGKKVRGRARRVRPLLLEYNQL